jgi:hypothetical protein
MFKKAVILLMLLTTPFAQARAVLICSMMNGQVVEHCCCPGHADQRAPIRHRAHEAAACCDVVVQVSDKAFAGVSADQPTVKRAGHDVPDSDASPAPVAVVPTFVVAARPRPSADTSSNPAPDRLYLRTARLRL